ncbi:MAG: 50S ribosomal protein L9 [Alphaproteobacteria bacterium]|nr:50S ribosomal protein L9 [Alphaproteobacteria bacterium]
MEVILLERIARLGQMGDVVNVKPGFARNFLLPRKKALRATAQNRTYFDQRRTQLETDNIANKAEAEKVAGSLEGLTVTLLRQAGESGQLYGSVTARDVAQSVVEAGVTVDKRQVTLDRGIKTLGLHPVKVTLHPEVMVQITVNVARNAEEAGIQLERGGALTDAERLAEEDAAASALAAAERALALADEAGGEDDSATDAAKE